MPRRGSSSSANTIWIDLPVSPYQPSNPQKRQRLPSYVYGNHPPGRSHPWREADREVAAPCAEIDDGVAGIHVQGFDDLVGTLPRVSFAFDLFEPHERESRLPGHIAE
jgi:hypothetical protein